ncbi:MAG: hypothetical protein ACHQDE_06600 [Acidimicrobiia bacterium]
MTRAAEGIPVYALCALVLVACSSGVPVDATPTDAGGRKVNPPDTGPADAGKSGKPMDAGTSVKPGDAGLPKPNVRAIFTTGCATSSMQSALLPSNLLFVIDRSASMACNPPPTTDSAVCEQNPVRVDATLPSKWEIVRGALRTAITALPDDTVVGLSYFSNDDACGVHENPSVPLLRLDSAQRSGIEASLSNVEPSGATPLVGATILAYRHMHDLALAGTIHGKQFVVLLTDGQQSDACSDPNYCSGQQSCTDLLVNQEVPKAAGPGVRIDTFVIGAPGSEPARQVLSKIAKNGDTAPPGCDVSLGNCHFDMTTQPKFDQALADALSSIAGRALTCALPMPEPTDGGALDPKLVNVVYSPADGSSPVLVPKDDSSPCDSGANGWQYSQDGSTILLCGPACDTLRKDRGDRVDVVLGCPVHGPT